MGIKILHGNCLDRLKDLEDQSINTCITSPPYWGLRNYQEEEQLGLEETPEAFVENLVEVFREVKRVLRDDGTVWLNLGDSYSSGGRTTTTMPTLRKKGKDEASGKQEYLNNFAVRPPNVKGIKPKDLVGIPFRVAFALQADGWYLRQDIIWHKPNPMPESVKDRCTKAHEYIFLLSKNAKYYFDNEAIKEDAKQTIKSNLVGKKVRVDYRPLGTIKDVVTGSDKTTVRTNKRNKRSVWTVTTKPFKGAHFATFPMDLIEPCVLAGCPENVCVECDTPYKRKIKVSKSLDIHRNLRSGTGNRAVGGVLDKYNRENPPIDLGLQKQCQCKSNETKSGTVLDPFGGSGTTAEVANAHNRDAVLIELNEEYIEIAKERLAPDGDLFTEIEVF